MIIHLIRHGYTNANEQKCYCGRTDLPLSQEGIARLQALKAQGAYPYAAAFYTSGMLRALQTLTVIYGDVKASSIAELAEYDFGVFEMRSHNELQYDPAYIAWIADETEDVACPGGECKRQYRHRVMSGFSLLLFDIQRKDLTSVSVVIHGGTIVEIMSRLFPGEKDFYTWQPSPGLGYTLCRNRNELFTYQPIH